MKAQLKKFKIYFPVRLFVLFAVVSLLSETAPVAQEENRLKATAPDNYVEIKDTLSGSYFVFKPLKDRYDELVAKLQNLGEDIEAGRIGGTEAKQQLDALQAELVELRELLNKSMKLVTAAVENKITESIKFDLGPEKCLVINADNVTIMGWEENYVRVDIEKVVLSKPDVAVDDQMASLQIVHEHRRANDLVGRTRAEVQAEEEKFLASEDGKKLTPEHREIRKKLLNEIESQYSMFGDFQGKEIDTVHIVGLTGQEGNRQITIELKSNEGESHRSVWQRHARLTVYVPKTNAMAVRGGLEHLDIQDVKTSLIVTSQGSHNRDYEGEYKIRGVEGSVLVSDSPINHVENVSGNVTIISARDFANSGTQHDGSNPGPAIRRHYFYPALPCTCQDIRGNLVARFARVNLTLQQLGGKVDVRNDFGNTTFTTGEKLAIECHRVVSESGRIELNIKPEHMAGMKLFAITQCGVGRTNSSEKFLDSVSFSGPDDDGIMQNWSGFRTPPDPNSFDLLHTRLNAAVRGEPRETGLDLISRGGMVVVTVPSE